MELPGTPFLSGAALFCLESPFFCLEPPFLSGAALFCLEPPFFDWSWSQCRSRPHWVGVGSGTLGCRSQNCPKKLRLRNTAFMSWVYKRSAAFVLTFCRHFFINYSRTETILFSFFLLENLVNMWTVCVAINNYLCSGSGSQYVFCSVFYQSLEARGQSCENKRDFHLVQRDFSWSDPKKSYIQTSL